MKRWKLFFVIFLLLGIILILFQHKFLLSEYAKFFTINNAKPGADAIVVLSGAEATRIPHALRLFNEGYAPRLILTEEKKHNHLFADLFPTNDEIARAIIEKLELSVPIITVPSIKGGATSTFDEAYDLKKFSEKEGFIHLIIVTDAFHTRRALHAFNSVFDGTKIRLEMSAAQNEIFDENNWWTSDKGISAYVLESIKYPIYLISSKNVNFIRND